MVVDAEVNEANQTTLGSARRSVIKNNLTEPTLLEMSGNLTTQDLYVRVSTAAHKVTLMSGRFLASRNLDIFGRHI